jgi:sucrose-6-phosphate hydrolase SacC (GH32 family)
MNPQAKSLKLRILVDRTTVEAFGNDGEIVMPARFLPKDDDLSLKLFATGGTARVVSLKIHKLKSVWKEA